MATHPGRTKASIKNCNCDRQTWGSYVKDKPCGEFVLNERQGYCLNCAHGEKCHPKKRGPKKVLEEA